MRLVRRELGLQFSLRAAAVCSLLAANLGAASTAPIRNSDPAGTANPSETSNPIYYPISASDIPEENVAPETLLRLFMERHSATEYPAAVEAAMRLCRVIPDRPEGHYNLACALSRMHRTTEALEALQKSIDCGWRDLSHLELDSDLANIRSQKRFEEIVAGLKAAIGKERIAPRPLRLEPWVDVAEDLRQQTPQIMARHHVPGTSIALVRDGEVVWIESFGVRDRRSSDQLAHADRFRVRAPLHLLAMIAAGQQQAEGRVEIAKLLEDGAQLDQPPPRALRPGNNDTTGRQVTNVATDSRERKGRRGHCQREPNYSSNGVYGLVRLAVEMASNQVFSEYCQGRILAPLLMESTDFSKPIASDINLVSGHSQLGSPMDPDPKSNEIAAGGSIYTTAHDLARLINEILQASQIQAESPKQIEPVASPLSVQEQLHVCVPWVFDLVQEADGMIPHGLGLAMKSRQTEYGRRIEVADEVSGMGCLMRWYPEKNLGVVVLYNSATGEEAARQIAQIALGGAE